MALSALRQYVPIRAVRDPAPLVPVVRLVGVIGGPSGPLRQGMNLATLAGPLELAFSMRRAKAVALAINSPGGSPVQSQLIHDRIRQLAAEKKKPVYAFCEDVAASGGYWLACAGDEIYADRNSIVGSIGVITGTFGFERLLEKIGVERRLYTSGDRKSFLDPFSPLKEEDVKRLSGLQKEMHDSFKAHVRERRADRLKGSDRRLFSGEFWTGAKALELGLIDGIGNLRGVCREKFGERVKLRLIEPSRPWLRRRFGLSGMRLPEPVAWADGLIAAVEARALWARFGL